MKNENQLSDKANDVSFYQGLNRIDSCGKNSTKIIKDKLAELSKVKNIHFLLGAGASSDAIPNMQKMKDKIGEDLAKSDINLKTLYQTFKDDNLEILLGAMYSKKYYLEQQNVEKQENGEKQEIEKLIKYIEKFIYNQINIDLTISENSKTLELYKNFYQKITLRNKDLSRVNIFTTNNDLFNEKAMDDLNINYNNGFGGGLERVFNPARFRFTFSQKVDANLEKFEPIENMAYLYKLHGSISWVEKSNELFNIQEIAIKGGEEKTEDNQTLIYPTPLKQGQSLGSPYSDLIREFQTKLSYSNSVLFVIGYSFSDEHINNIIYQSLTSNASLIIVIFGEAKECPLSKINDNRIYRIFGENENEKIHHFQYIVKELLPNLEENKEKTLLNDFVKALKDERK